LKKIHLYRICFFFLIFWSKSSFACDPLQPTLLDTVSIDPLTGNITVSWFQNPSPQTHYYVVYVYNPLSDPPWDAIDTVYGATNISTFLTGLNTFGGNFIIAVSAVDSCGNPSFFSFSTAHNTMHLSVDYNPCNLESKLTWNKYRNWPNGVLSYRIWASEQGGAFQQIGATTSDTTFIHSNINPLKNVCYLIQAIDGSSTKSASSNLNCIFSNFPAAPTFSYIRHASVIGPKAVALSFYVDAAADVKEYIIERRITGRWTTIKTIYPQAINGNYFSAVDSTAETGSYSYEYRLRTINICGVESDVSSVSKTMLLTAMNDPIYQKNALRWNDYEGFASGVGRYQVFRSVGLSQPFANLGNVLSALLEYEESVEELYAGNGEFCYYILAIENGVNQFGLSDSSKSNVVCIEQAPLVYVPNAFTPEGHNPVFKPVFSYLEPSNYRLSIFNRWGQLVFETTDSNLGWNGQTNAGNAPNAVYVYRLEYSSAFGQSFLTNGTVTLIR
jgi:gliding motility-associated-like protein